MCRTVTSLTSTHATSADTHFTSSTILTDRESKIKLIIEDLVKDLPSELDGFQVAAIVKLLNDYQDVLSADDVDIGYTDLVSQKIDMGGPATNQRSSSTSPTGIHGSN
jgi:hypothetical protein